MPVRVCRLIFGALLTVCIVVIHGSPSSIPSTIEPFVCGNANYTKWHVPCGMACTPAKDSGMQKATATNKINEQLRQLILLMKEAQAIIKDLKRDDRIRNTDQVNSIENETEYAFINGNIDFKNDERKLNSLNVMEITKADYNLMVAAIMFTEQMRFNEDSSKINGQLSNDLRGLSDKLATILCYFEIIQCISGNVPSTKLTCQSTVAEYIRWSKIEETRMPYEYGVLQDIENYLAVLITKYYLQ